MDINFSKEDIAFREEVREWLPNDYPKHVKEKTDNGIALTKQDMIDFHKALSKKGWMGYNWPVEYGGTGWSSTQLYIFNKHLQPFLLLLLILFAYCFSVILYMNHPQKRLVRILLLTKPG